MVDVDVLAATIRAALSDAVFHGEVGYEQAVEALDALVAEARRAQTEDAARTERVQMLEQAVEGNAEILAGVKALRAERDEWKRRAEEAEKATRVFREGKYVAVRTEDYRALTGKAAEAGSPEVTQPTTRAVARAKPCCMKEVSHECSSGTRR